MTSREQLRGYVSKIRDHCSCGELDCESSERAVDVLAAAVREALEEALEAADAAYDKETQYAATPAGVGSAMLAAIRALMPGEKP